MVSFTLLCAAIAASVTSVVASPLELLKQHEARGIQPGTGTHNGFFYSYWTDGRGSVDYNNGARGSYKVSWNNVNNWVGGKGWKPGPPRVVKYNGTWNNYNVNSCKSGSCPLRQHMELTGCRPLPLRLDHQPARRVLHRRGLRHVQPLVGHAASRHHRR